MKTPPSAPPSPLKPLVRALALSRGALPVGFALAGFIQSAVAAPPSVIDLSALDGVNGFLANAAAGSGKQVVATGDVNGDGIPDLIVGSPGASPGGRSGAGQVAVVFGTRSGFPSTIGLSGLSGVQGFVLQGGASGDAAGSALAVGDVNGDGIGDLVIGAPGASPSSRSGAGEVAVVYGSGGGFPSSLDPSTLDGGPGFVLQGGASGDAAGSAVAVGDVNGDDIGDLVIGSPGASPGGHAGAGEAAVVFGRADGLLVSFDLATLSGADGFVFDGADDGDAVGSSVASGDLNAELLTCAS
jgi:hypothetical protein